jgi:hypothetical protein
MTMHVVFVEPCFPAGQREFVRGLSLTGATVSAVGEHPAEALDDELRRWLLHYEQVPSVVDADALERVVQWIHHRLPVDRLEATVEAHVVPVAEARARLGLPGTPLRAALLCRDKGAVKETLRSGGVPCAASLGSGDHEAFYDTITIGGRVAHEFITHCYPNVLEAMRTRWISPQLVATNRVETAPSYQEVLEMGRTVNTLLGIDTSATHTAWFFGPEGLRFSDIGCRPPAARAWDLYAAGNDIDIYHEWAMAVALGRTVRKASRRLAAGIVALRPEQDGVIRGYEGGDEIWRRYGEWIIDSHFPPPGTPTQPIDRGYLANAWLRMKHPDYDQLRGMLDAVGETIRVRAG